MRRRPWHSPSTLRSTVRRRTRTSTERTTRRRLPSMTPETDPAAAGTTIPSRGLTLPPPRPPRFSLTLKSFFAAALLILIAVGGAIAISAYRARGVADAKIEEDLKKAGPAWESFQQNR